MGAELSPVTLDPPANGSTKTHEHWLPKSPPYLLLWPFDEKRMIEWSRVGHRLAFLCAIVPA